jgi:hemoglobin
VTSIYAAMGGEDAVQRLAQAWHTRCLADPVVSHAFARGHHPAHTDRLAAYWGEQLGGPARYTATIGDHSGVLAMHSGNGEHHEMDRLAEACFAGALDDVAITEPRLRESLTAWFAAMIAEMSRFPDSRGDVPVGESVPKWSWDGRVG